jgi:hypothetical protein
MSLPARFIVEAIENAEDLGVDAIGEPGNRPVLLGTSL